MLQPTVAPVERSKEIPRARYVSPAAFMLRTSLLLQLCAFQTRGITAVYHASDRTYSVTAAAAAAAAAATAARIRFPGEERGGGFRTLASVASRRFSLRDDMSYICVCVGGHAAKVPLPSFCPYVKENAADPLLVCPVFRADARSLPRVTGGLVL